MLKGLKKSIYALLGQQTHFDHKYFHACSLLGVYKVEKASLSKLRKKTGFTFSNCKKALEKYSGDLVEAEKWLKEEALKQGWVKATKLQGRPMSQGLVGLIRNDNGTVMLEVNCETDFVAKNAKFQNLVATLTKSCHRRILELGEEKVELNKEQIGSLPVDDNTVSDLIAYEVGNIGENIAARRAVGFTAGNNVTHIGSYVHTIGPPSPGSQCEMGKFAALVLLQQSSDAAACPDTLRGLGVQISQHIVGMNPLRLGAEDGEPQSEKEEESALLYQPFMLDPEQEVLVKDILADNSLTVSDFVRYECGESLSDDQ